MTDIVEREFWEKHHGDFDQFGNYIPYSQMDGDLRVARDEIERLRADNKDLMEDHRELHKARDEIERLRRLVQYCRMRLKRDAYREYVDKCLADLSVLEPDPEMQGKLVQSSWKEYY